MSCSLTNVVCCTGQYHEGVRAKWLAEKAGHRYRHPYDVGVFTNLVTVSSNSLSYFHLASRTTNSTMQDTETTYVLPCIDNLVLFFLCRLWDLVSLAGSARQQQATWVLAYGFKHAAMIF